MKTDAFPEMDVPLNSEDTWSPSLFLLNSFSVFTMDWEKDIALKKQSNSE